jgi:hypothetical protein
MHKVEEAEPREQEFLDIGVIASIFDLVQQDTLRRTNWAEM